MPATAIQEQDYDGDGKVFAVEYFSGLTKREHFAGLAMQSLLAGDEASDYTRDGISLEAIAQADSILKELEASDENNA